MTEILQRGDRARLTANTPEGWHISAREGDTFEVWEYAPALKEGDEGYGNDEYTQVAMYEGWGVRGTMEIPADIVEKVELVPMPSVEEISRFVASELCTSGDLDINETDPNPEGGKIACYGRLPDGRTYGFMLKVMDRWWTDD
jgi:hypothetical protein